ncbi:MAG: Rieske (2Fe-2S) protein, partial [Halioglobus sp.]|nr:Rieske (2Fe-2S) protein [Halioglobus sp.]
MNHPKPVTLIATLARRVAGDAAGPAACNKRVPVSAYTDPQRYEVERERLFLNRPQVLGHASQLAAAGDAIAWDWLGLPLLTLRDNAGNIATFKNVCRHRGMRLVQDEGCTQLRSLVCPYHQWTYGLDGALRNI